MAIYEMKASNVYSNSWNINKCNMKMKANNQQI